MDIVLAAFELRGLHWAVQFIRGLRHDDAVDRAVVVAAIEGALGRARRATLLARATGGPVWEAKAWQLQGELCEWLGDITGALQHRSEAQDAYRRAAQLLDVWDDVLGF